MESVSLIILWTVIWPFWRILFVSCTLLNVCLAFTVILPVCHIHYFDENDSLWILCCSFRNEVCLVWVYSRDGDCCVFPSCHPLFLILCAGHTGSGLYHDLPHENCMHALTTTSKLPCDPSLYSTDHSLYNEGLHDSFWVVESGLLGPAVLITSPCMFEKT